jgi:hypothetical protein
VLMGMKEAEVALLFAPCGEEEVPEVLKVAEVTLLLAPCDAEGAPVPEVLKGATCEFNAVGVSVADPALDTSTVAPPLKVGVGVLVAELTEKGALAP